MGDIDNKGDNACVRLKQGRQTHLHQGSHQPRGCLQRAEIILGLYKRNYLTRGKEFYIWPFLMWAPSENEFDTPGLKGIQEIFACFSQYC